ncbi:MAG: hypothetical protein NC187_08100 [Candidatus Amulumruptor caecigallinarius]|nr:hypothetical protein [Candidatus Amulumruptor caecigallinarius]MCM1397430.1 hypothetical protein [Candidatus Amulumruptor caecigallinarius]MCM1454363.1 hypothetical protein [bacterium]
MEETALETDGMTAEANLDIRVKVKKAKVSKGGCVEASYTDQDGNEITIKGKNKCHQDLRDALARLIPFFADITEQKEADRIDWDNIESEENADLLKKIEVSGVSIGGDASNKIITLTGKRTLFTGRILNLNSPGIELDSETFYWDHTDDFDIAVNGFFYEVEQYIVNRKWEVVQPSLFSDDPDDPFGEATPTEPVPPIDEATDNVA